MREILFRGKRYDDGSWAEGYLIHDEFCNTHIPYIGYLCDAGHDVDIAEIILGTVGQFTGLTDKTGKKIFEGDIIKSDNGKQAAVSIVKFGEHYPKMFYKMLDMFSPGKKHLPAVGFYAQSVDKGEEMILFQSPCVTVIGNIHDNPELLEGTE